MSLPLLLLACASPSIDEQPVHVRGPSAFAVDHPEPRVLTPFGLPIPGSQVPSDVPDPVPLTPTQAVRAKAVIAEARRHIGQSSRWEGRDTEQHPGFDCLGILFRSYGTVTGTPWTEYSVDPSKLVASGKLGQPVAGLGGALRAQVPVRNLMPGDLLYFLDPGYELQDDPLAVIDGKPYWPWHTGLYLDDGTVLHADPRSTVRTQPLEERYFHALVATRLP